MYIIHIETKHYPYVANYMQIKDVLSSIVLFPFLFFSDSIEMYHNFTSLSAAKRKYFEFHTRWR